MTPPRPPRDGAGAPVPPLENVMLDALFNLVPTILDALFAVVAVASAVVAITPTPRDDVFVGKVYRVIEWLALAIGRAKDAPPNRTPPPPKPAPARPDDAARNAGG